MADWTKRFSIAGRKAMVTGASKGIGAEIARVFADAGADVVAVARDADGLAETAAAVRAKDVRCLTIEADLGDAQAPGQAALKALGEWGTIDILVNSAGISRTGPATEFSLADWDETMAVNLRAPFFKMVSSFRSLYDPRYVLDPRGLGLVDSAGKALSPGQTGADKGVQPPVSGSKP